MNSADAANHHNNITMPTVTFKDIVERARQHEAYWVEAALYHFTETIYGLMESGGMSRTVLAQKLGVSPAYITKLLRGDANVTIKTMVRLARVFGREVQIALPQQKEGQGKVSAAVVKENIGAWRFEIPTGLFPAYHYTNVPSSPQQARTDEKQFLAA